MDIYLHTKYKTGKHGKQDKCNGNIKIMPPNVVFKEFVIDCFLSLLYGPLSSVIWRIGRAYPAGGTDIHDHS